MTILGSIAVIDIGKTNAKLVLLDPASGHEIAVRSRTNAVLPGPPYPHFDIDGLWAFILDTLRDFEAKHGVSAISITTHGATAAVVSGGELALPVLDYEHEGPDETAQDYARVRPAYGETLSPELPGGLNLGAQLFWQQTRFPEPFGTATAILMYPQYWAFKLTGSLASEATSLGTHTDLWNPLRANFSSLVAKQNWHHLLPPLRPANSVLGTFLPEVAERTGISPETPVTVGIHDSNASLLPHLKAMAAPFNVISSGTWTIIMHVGGDTGALDQNRDSLANVDFLGRPVPTARFMGGREYEVLAGPDAPAPCLGDARQVMAKGIMALPSFAAGVGPFPQAIGRWVGSSAGLPEGERAAAASLYLALMALSGLELCGTGQQIVVEGPLARNEVFVSALAVLTGVPVIISGDATGTSLGAAMLFDNFTESVGNADARNTRANEAGLEGLKTYAAKWRELAGRN